MKTSSDFRFKYGTLVVKLGFVQVPNMLVRNRKSLNLTRSEQELAIILLSYEFNGTTSCPSFVEIAKKNGMSSRTIHEAKSGLESKQYLRINRTQRNKYKTHQYDLSGLRKKIRKLAGIILDNQFIEKKILEEEYRNLKKIDSREEGLFTESI